MIRWTVGALARSRSRTAGKHSTTLSAASALLPLFTRLAPQAHKTDSRRSTPADIMADITHQITSTQSRLKALKAEQANLSNPQHPPDDPDAQLAEAQQLLRSREEQLEQLARAAREALQLQSMQLEMRDAERAHSQTTLSQSQSRIADLERHLRQEKDKTQLLTGKLQGVISRLDQSSLSHQPG